MNEINFGTRLRNLRVTSGKTQVQVARELGISQTEVSAFELKTKRPTRKTVEMWSRYYGVPAETFTDRDFQAEDEGADLHKRMDFSIGKAVRSIRLSKSMSQYYLAECMGIDNSAVSYMESRDELSSVETAMKYAEGLGVTFEYLCAVANRKENPKPSNVPSRRVSSVTQCPVCNWRGTTSLIMCPNCGADIVRPSLNGVQP